MLKHGKKTRLIPFGKEHLPLFVKWQGDIDNIDFFRHFTFPFSNTEAEGWYERNIFLQLDRKLFIIIDKNNNTIGLIHLFDLMWQTRKVELGILIGEKGYRGTGHAFDSLVVICDYIFNKLNFNKVCIRVNEANERLIRFCKKGGFEIEGILKDEIFYEGRFYNAIYLALFQKIFQERYVGYFDDPSMSMSKRLRMSIKKR